MASEQDDKARTRRYTLEIRRQDSLEKPETVRVEERVVDLDPKTSVLAALKLAEENAEGNESPIAHDGECFEGVCGACTMLVQGRVRLACTTSLASVADKRGAVRLAPLNKFPLIRDLVVDRSRISDGPRRLHLFEPSTASSSAGGASQSADQAALLARLDGCIQCGACLEACPQYGDHSEFVGAHALHQLSVQNRKVGSEPGMATRLEAAMAPGGIQSCGQAQNCVEVCPVELPLADSLQSVARQTTRHMIFGWLLG